MSGLPRRASVAALAKINLDLRVLHKRPDGFHELRTVFQTISLADTIEIEYAPARATSIEIDSTVEISDNLVVRAARLAMDAMRATGRIGFRLTKRIPMGAGLGGGSSDAAAVLLALPVLAGKRIEMATLIELGACLGSDVPFFLLGGRALGLGRGTELYPLPEHNPGPALVVAPGIHVSTPEAYKALGRELTSSAPQNIISIFESAIWSQGPGDPPAGINDFESVVFEQHPQLKKIKRQLLRSGARHAMLSGSGSALFGIFGSRAATKDVCRRFGSERAFPVSFVTRARYRSLWWKRLATHTGDRVWPPRSQYGR